MMKEYYTTALIIAKTMKNRLSMLLFILLVCSCNNNGKSGVLAAVFIHSTTNDCFSDFYIEITKDMTVECTKGLATEEIYALVYENKELKPGADNFISNNTWPTEVIDYEKRIWVNYRKRQESHVIDKTQWEKVKTCLSNLSKNTPDNIFPKVYGTDKWKWDNAAVFVMYKGDVYTFWHDSKQEAEKNLYQCLEDISPIKLILPSRDNKPPTEVVRIK